MKVDIKFLIFFQKLIFLNVIQTYSVTLIMFDGTKLRYAIHPKARHEDRHNQYNGFDDVVSTARIGRITLTFRRSEWGST